MNHNVYLCDIPVSPGSSPMPYLWCSLKTYFEENSLNSSKWSWSDPWLFNFNLTNEELFLILEKNPPTIFGFSVYVWNQLRIEELTVMIKSKYPNCLIVYGGPQIDIKYSDNFFKDNPAVDIVVPSDAYGEIVFHHILDAFTGYAAFPYTDIPYIYYTNANKDKLFSNKSIDKKSFKWPSNIFASQEKYLLPHLQSGFFSLYETTRGCPYECSYCDWGGGTHTKVVKKPFTIILDELEWLCSHGVGQLHITDANFGIFEIDLEITDQIVNFSKKYSFPTLVSISNAKNNFDRVIKITEKLTKANLQQVYKIAIQSADEVVSETIKRINVPFAKQIKKINELQSQVKDLPIKVETILGLPGSTYSGQLEEINNVTKYGLPPPDPYTWMLLPEAPAAAPDYRNKFKLVTVKKIESTRGWQYKSWAEAEAGIELLKDWTNPKAETVVGCSTYSPNDWIKMKLAIHLARSFFVTGALKFFLPYLKKYHNFKISDLITFTLDNFILTSTPNFTSEKLNLATQKISQHYHDWIYGDKNDFGIDPGEEFPLLMTPYFYNIWVIMMYANDFYYDISNSLSIKYADPKIKDLGKFMSNIVIDLEYDPRHGRTFETEYNWLSFYNDNKKLKQGNYNYTLTDQQIKVGTVDNYHDLNWYQYRENEVNYIKQYFYVMSSSHHIPKCSQTIKLSK